MHRRFVWLLAITVGFEGIRGGAGFFRALLDLPARSRIGLVAFAELSRATDLSITGIVFYAIHGIGGLVLTGLLFLLALRWRLPLVVRWMTGVAAICSTGVLVLTFQAAPLMFRIGASPSDPVALAALIEPFVVLTNLRIALVVVSFAAVTSALMSLALADRRVQA